MVKKKVDDDELPPGDAVGLMADGTLNIGTPEEMRKRFEQAQVEAAEAEESDDASDLDELDEAFEAD